MTTDRLCDWCHLKRSLERILDSFLRIFASPESPPAAAGFTAFLRHQLSVTSVYNVSAIIPQISFFRLIRSNHEKAL